MQLNDPSLEDQIAAAKAYDSLFGPALFDQWVTKVADAANIQSGQRVLDVACGTGDIEFREKQCFHSNVGAQVRKWFWCMAF